MWPEPALIECPCSPPLDVGTGVVRRCALACAATRATFSYRPRAPVPGADALATVPAGRWREDQGDRPQNGEAPDAGPQRRTVGDGEARRLGPAGGRRLAGLPRHGGAGRAWLLCRGF